MCYDGIKGDDLYYLRIHHNDHLDYYMWRSETQKISLNKIKNKNGHIMPQSQILYTLTSSHKQV